MSPTATKPKKAGGAKTTGKGLSAAPGMCLVVLKNRGKIVHQTEVPQADFERWRGKLPTLMRDIEGKFTMTISGEKT
jgi:hypothetical protein